MESWLVRNVGFYHSFLLFYVLRSLLWCYYYYYYYFYHHHHYHYYHHRYYHWLHDTGVFDNQKRPGVTDCHWWDTQLGIGRFVPLWAGQYSFYSFFPFFLSSVLSSLLSFFITLLVCFVSMLLMWVEPQFLLKAMRVNLAAIIYFIFIWNRWFFAWKWWS